MVPRAPVAISDNRRLDAVALIIGFALIAGAAWLAAASLRLRGAIDFLLAVYVGAAGAIVLVALVLSPFEAFTRAGVLIASAVLTATAGGAWVLRGRPAPPAFGPAARSARETLRDPVVAVPAAAVGAGLAYSAALAVATPPNDYDSLWYHLPRAALWRQEHAVGYVERANDLRLDFFTPGAEIVSSWIMVLEGSERFAALFQLVALVALVLAVAGIARRLGLEPRAAALGAVLFASLPVVVLQASTALNDVAVASFIVIVVYFVLEGRPTGLAVGAVSLGLAVAMKATALLALPLLALVVFALSPWRRWPAIALAGAAGIVLGAFWYVVNLAETGSLIPRYAPVVPGPSLHNEETALLLPALVARLAVDAFDPAGSVGRDRYLYAVAGAALIAAGVAVAARRRSRTVAVAAAVAAGLVLVPILFVSLHDRLLRGFQRFWLEVEPDLAFMGFPRDAIAPSPFVSWYGPLGMLLLVVSVPLAIREVRRGVLRRAGVLLALLPVLYVVPIAAALAYSSFHGRYLMPAVALAATTWGLVLRVRPFAWAAAAIAAVAVCLSFVHYREKPAGFAILGGSDVESVWSESRLESFAHALAPGGGGPLGVLERRAAAGDTVALRIRQDDVSYPFFGADLDRRIVFVDDTGGLDEEADWLVVAPGLSAAVCSAGWRSLPTGEPGWRLYRRIGLCPGETADS